MIFYYREPLKQKAGYLTAFFIFIIIEKENTSFFKRDFIKQGHLNLRLFIILWPPFYMLMFLSEKSF